MSAASIVTSSCRSSTTRSRSSTERLRRSIREGKTATLATQVLPAVLGGDGNRRYILAMQNPAEARATGGIFGNWAELTAVNGKLDLGERGKSDALNPSGGSPRVLNAPDDYASRYARFAPERFWQNVNVSPDLPTVGKVAIDIWNQAGRPPVNGVIAADSLALGRDPAHHRTDHRAAVAGPDHRRQRRRRDAEAGVRALCHGPAGAGRLPR